MSREIMGGMVVFLRKGPGHRGTQHVWPGWLPWFPFQVPHPLLDPSLEFCQQNSYREAFPGTIIGSEDVRCKEESQASLAQCSEPSSVPQGTTGDKSVTSHGTRLGKGSWTVYSLTRTQQLQASKGQGLYNPQLLLAQHTHGKSGGHPPVEAQVLAVG